MREHLDIEGYDRAVKELSRRASEDQRLNETFILNLHRVLLKEPYEVETSAPDGRNTRRPIAVGAYKTTPNNIVTSTGETYYFTPPEQVPRSMSALLDWYHAREDEGEHPIIIAAIFHYRFVRIHPFDDGNGRMARLLMNRILLDHGYPLAIVRRDARDRYLQELERTDQTEDPGQFIDYIASCCEYPLNLYLRAARGESIEDIDREIVRFRQALVTGNGAHDQLDLQRYLAAVVLPFYAYSRSKFRALTADLFSPGGDTPPRVTGRSADGRNFRLARVSEADRVPQRADRSPVIARLSPAPEPYCARVPCPRRRTNSAAGRMSMPSSVRRAPGSRQTTMRRRTLGCSSTSVRSPRRCSRVMRALAFASTATSMSPSTKSTSMPLGSLQ